MVKPQRSAHDGHDPRHRKVISTIERHISRHETGTPLW
jgi:hypothetical protein